MSQVTVPMLPRMRELWDAGLSYAAIAAVVSLDWGKDITEHQARKALVSHARGTGSVGGARPGAKGLSKLSGRRYDRSYQPARAAP